MPQRVGGETKIRHTFRRQTLGIKALLIVLFVFGGGSLVYGAYVVQNQVVSPFKLGGLSADTIVNQILPKPDQSDALASKTKDTDGDGLTDYDEVALYGTSPYLPDTDGDGISDGQEIKNGTDPNCKPGETCGGLRLVTPDTKISDLFPQFSTSNVTLKDKTVQEFRQILVEQGFDKSKLDKISDNTLLIMLEESLKVQDEENTTTPTTTDAITEKDYDDLRQLLIDMGVPKDEVYSMSNKDVEDLLKTFK